MIFLFACDEEKNKQEIYIAEVGSAKLTQQDLDKQLGDIANISKYKEEFIRNWIETEILNQISDEKNLLTEENYTKILEASGRELAASIAIDEYLNAHPINYSEADLNKYFTLNKGDYSFSEDVHVLNYIAFYNEENAISFRSNAISNGWANSLAGIVKDSILIESQQNRVLKLSEIQSKRTIRVLKKLFRNEISLVVKTELNNFIVVQQIDKIPKNTIPKFKFVKDNVRKSYIVLKQREQIRNYLDSLISHKNVKIY